MLSRYTSGELGAHSSFATYLALDGSLLATYDKNGNGKVRVWDLATNGSLSLNRLINSPDTAHDTPTFGESIFLAGNRLGIGSGNTWKGNPHDGRFYIYDVTNGSKKTDFNPASHSAQYFGRESSFSTDVFCVSESGNSSWNTDAAYTFYHLNNFSTTNIHRYVHPGSYSYIGGMDSSGDVFVTTVEDPSDRHLFVWKVSRDGLNQPTGVSKFAEFTETGTNTVKGKIATNGQFIAVGISSSSVNGTNSGRVTLFEINGNGSITKLHTLVPPDVAAGMKFGSSVKFVGNVLLVGSPYASTSSPGTGKVYAYLIADSNPPPAPVSFHPSTGQSGDTFGTFLAHSGNRLAVSAGQSVVFTYDVTNLASWATPNQAPVFTTPSIVNVPENQTLTIDVNATDGDGDGLTYSLASGADKAKFDLNSSTGVLTFKIPPDFEVNASAAGNNTYAVTVQVTDGTSPVTQAITVNVTDDPMDDSNINSGLLGYYPFDGNLLDVSGSGNHGANNGATPGVDRNGIAGMAYGFDGNDSLNVPGVQNDNNFSIGFWVKHTGSGAGLLEIRASHDNVFTLAVTDQGDLFLHRTSQSISSANVGANTAKVPLTGATVGTLPQNQWTHVVVAFGSNTNVYLDNTLAGSSVINAIGLANAPIRLGAAIGSTVDTVADGVSITVSPYGNSNGTNPNANPVVDGNRHNIFHGKDYQNHTFTIDLGSAQKVSRISMIEGFYASNPNIADWVHGTIKAYGLKYSTDGANYQNAFANYVLEGSLVRNKAYTRTFAETSARYWKVTATDRFGVVAFTSEIELWRENWLTGGMDEVRIYNRALSAAEVTALYNLEKPNLPPVFTTPSSVSVPENQTLALDANASDPDGSALVYSIAGGADQAKFDLNSSTGVLTFKIPPDFEVTGSVAGNNAYSVTIQVTDGTVAATQALTINVTNLNEPPVFSNPTSVSVLENQTLALTVNASDPDGDSLIYSLAGGADQALFVLNSFNSSTGLLTFKNAPDFEANASSAGNNTYAVTVQVTDGTSPVTQALTINVSDVYEPFVARQGTDRMGSAFVRSYLKLNEKLVLGFEVTGGQAEVLIKGLGPSYAGTGLPHAVSDPMVSLFDSGGQPILANDDWPSGPRAIHLTEASLTPASPKEAALLVTLSPGTYSVLCEANGAQEGMTGVEVREVGGSPGVRLNVLRANGSVSPQNPLVQGITVEGPNPRKLMIRAKGESSLGHQGVTSALKDPVLSASAYDPGSGSYSLIAENGNWESGHRASEVAQTGFAPSTGSTDAVLLLDLLPGSYLFEANDQNGSGNGLVVTEVYDLGPGQSALDRPPVGIKLSVNEVPENAPVGTVVGVIGSTDPEDGSSPSHALHDPQGTSDNGSFVLDADGSLRTARVFDYEKNATYRIAVRATDDANSFSDAVIEVRVIDLFRPIVETGLVESLTGVSATLKGEVVDDGGMAVTGRGIVFSVDPDPELGKSGVVDLPAGKGTGPFSAQATGLEPGRKYYFRAYAKNGEGTGYGSDGELVTISDGPGWIDATPGEAKNWWTSPWLGDFFTSPNGWIMQAQLGWVFPLESPTAGLWLWKDGMGWLWTDKGVYPFLYGANGSGWHYFYGLHEGTTLFFDYQLKRWRTLE